MDQTRRFLLLGLAAGAIAATSDALAATRRRSSGRRRSTGRKPAAAAKAAPPPVPKKPDGQPLRIPELVAVGEAGYELKAMPATHAFLPDRPAPVAGYGGGYLGPVLKLKRGTTARLTLANGLDRPTNVHWHGLLVEGRADGGSHPGVAPGATWETALAVDQPAATLWYHAHMHGRVGADLHDGLAGMLIVEDDVSAGLGLPSTWGVDDIPLILQDKIFDDDGMPQYVLNPGVADHGFRGTRVAVNGTIDAVATVPQRLVRLRILNASSARIYRLFFADERPFKLVATDAGFLPAPLDADTLSLSPGERVELLVDFGDGGTSLMSTPDDHEHRAGSEVSRIPDRLTAPFRLCAFTTVRDDKPSHKVPARLVPAVATDAATAGLHRRRFVLQLGGAVAMSASPAHHDHGQHGAAAPAADMPVMAINGRTFDPGRIDEEVALGTTEIWDIVSPEMAHPFHMHGAHFRVLNEDGGIPKIWNRGIKDTVLVENSAQLLVTFTRAADREHPFYYHCHVLEHEDAGMMGTFTVA